MTDATITDHGQLTGIGKHPTWWDGQRGPNSNEIYYTIMTSLGEHIYLAENTLAGSTLTGRVAKIRKSDHVEVQSAGLGTQAWDGEPGHTAATVGVSGAGTVIARRGGHTYPLNVYVATGADLSTAAALANPAGAETRADYRKFYRGPDGTLYLNVRGNDQKGVLYRWSEGTAALVPVGNMPLLDQGTQGTPLIRLAWSPDGATMYAVAERANGGFGWPYQSVGCIKSTDGGTSWTTLAGGAITLPVDAAEVTTLHTAPISNNTIVATSSGPVVVGAWKNTAEGDAWMSLWVSAWTGTSWDHVRLLHHAAIPDAAAEARPPYRINHDTTYHAGRIYVVVRDPGADDLCLYVADATDLTAWDRHVLDTSGDFHGAQFDPHALADDGLIRIYPVAVNQDPSGYTIAGNPLQSEIWELAAPTDWAETTTTAGITTTTHTDTDLDPGSWYRYRVASTEAGIPSVWSAWLQVDPIPTATAAGATTWTGTATGRRAPAATAAGLAAWTGTATGTAPDLPPAAGTATGATTWAGQAAGLAPTVPDHAGAATGSTNWSGAATGTSARAGAATGTTTWSSAATGTSTRSGAATGSTTWTSAAAGTAPSVEDRTGAATGATTWTSTATGHAPAVDGRTGTATGTTSWTGTAAGNRHPKATAAGAIQWAGNTTGTTTRTGAATGTTSWTGTATGRNHNPGRDIEVRLSEPRGNPLALAGPHGATLTIGSPRRTP